MPGHSDLMRGHFDRAKQPLDHLGMLNWLAISTRPDLTTIQSLLAQHTVSPTQQHLDASRYVGRYLKATADYGISFSSKANSSLEGFIHFPLETTSPTSFADANWGPQDASTPSLKNRRPVSLNETRSICGHVTFMSGGWSYSVEESQGETEQSQLRRG
jgi:hypothetical protein